MPLCNQGRQNKQLLTTFTNASKFCKLPFGINQLNDLVPGSNGNVLNQNLRCEVWGRRVNGQ